MLRSERSGSSQGNFESRFESRSELYLYCVSFSSFLHARYEIRIWLTMQPQRCIERDDERFRVGRQQWRIVDSGRW